ncbi:hypothetical protein CLV67_10766 [Actinoplanes italicus]|uniref:Leucine rich repeat (LRR) protein n=1 Tax=Actinoplanes italicus TaxID=113567 RepID=A0A2T0KC12_9ACTN|nr:hypothetical protein CLV67_10766 [Actinoplanes italicus]
MGDDVGVGQPGIVNRFEDSRYRYVHPPDRPGIFGAGNAAECDYLTVDGAVRIPWGGSPRPGDVERIRSLHLCPTPAQLRKPRLPAYLPSLVNLESLSVPAPLVPHLASGGVGGRLRTLTVHVDHRDPIPEEPLDAAAALPGLTALMWVSGITTPRLPRIVDPLPPLEFLLTNVTGDPAVLRQVESLPTLRHLELIDSRNADVFDHIRAPLRTLELSGTGRAFPIHRLSTVPTLEALRLNTVRTEIDCAVFATLPELVDLRVLNCPRVVNVEALLDHPRLASVSFLSSRNPFGKEGKALFKSRGFARLDIDYS